MLSLILEFLTLHQNAKKVYWIPDREIEILFNDGVILDLLYFIYCDMMEQQKKTPLVLKEFLGETNGKKYSVDSLIRYSDYIAGVLASIDLKTGQGGQKKHQLLWQNAIGNNPRVVVLQMDSGSLSSTPLDFSFSLEGK